MKAILKTSLKWCKSHLVIALTLFVAFIGGIPGLITTYQYMTERPKIVMKLLRIDTGTLSWTENSVQYSYILFVFKVVNEETKPIVLPPKAFNLRCKLDGIWMNFENAYIPLSGTHFYRNDDCTGSANIDHLDLQKYRELNVGPLYGNYELDGGGIKAQYLNQKHYILFLSKRITDSDLKQFFKNFDSNSLPIELTWTDLHGKRNKPFLVIDDRMPITSGCYQVYGKTVKDFYPE